MQLPVAGMESVYQIKSSLTLIYEFSPAEAQRYKERSQAERTNARLKDDYGGRHIRVRGHVKVMSHLMFDILVLTADQVLRLLT